MVQPWAFHSQVRSSLRPRRDTEPNATAPGPSVPVACLGSQAFRPRVPSVGLTSPCGQVSRARPTVRKNVSRLGHHFHCRWLTRLVMVMGRHRQLFRVRPRRFRRWCTRTRCLSPTSAADFCCHEHPLGSQFPSPRLAPPGPSRPARSPCRRLSASSETEPSSTMSNSRFRHLRPWVVTWLTPRLPAAATCAALPEIPVASGTDPRQRSRLSASPVRWLHTPPVMIPASPGEPTVARTTRTRFHCCTSMKQLPRARDVFHRQVPQVLVRVFTRTLPYEPPLVPRFRHREPSFRHAFTFPLGALDQSVWPAIRWWPSGHMPPTGFCNWETHEHTCERSKPHVFAVANHRVAGSGLPFGPPLAGLSQARGRVALHALAAPRRDDRSSDGFTPTWSTQTSPVTNQCCVLSGSGQPASDHAVTVSCELIRLACHACAQPAF